MESEQRDTGLECLTLLLRFHQVSVDPGQVRHQFPGAPIGVTEMLRCAKQLALKTKAITTTWQQLSNLPLPAIVELKDRTFIIVGKVTDDGALVQRPSVGRPEVIKRAEFEYDWTGRIVLMARRASLADLGRRFDVTWFFQASLGSSDFKFGDATPNQTEVVVGDSTDITVQWSNSTIAVDVDGKNVGNLTDIPLDTTIGGASSITGIDGHVVLVGSSGDDSFDGEGSDCLMLGGSGEDIFLLGYSGSNWIEWFG